MRVMTSFKLAAAALTLSAAPAFAASDLSGFWVLQSDPSAVPAAASTPAAARRVKELMEAKGIDAPNGSPEYARVWCTPEGLPVQDTHTLPISVQQGKLTIAINYSTEAQPRHIYIDGQPHPAEDIYDYTPTGHSVGRWQGDALVVNTRYFNEGILVIPGGALRSQKSRLTERWRLVDNDTLRVNYTWTDPDTLRRPHSYSFTFKRAPGTVWITEPQCSPVRAMRAKGMDVPFGVQE